MEDPNSFGFTSANIIMNSSKIIKAPRVFSKLKNDTKSLGYSDNRKFRFRIICSHYHNKCRTEIYLELNPEK